MFVAWFTFVFLVGQGDPADGLVLKIKFQGGWFSPSLPQERIQLCEWSNLQWHCPAIWQERANPTVQDLSDIQQCWADTPPDGLREKLHTQYQWWTRLMLAALDASFRQPQHAAATAPPPACYTLFQGSRSASVGSWGKYHLSSCLWQPQWVNRQVSSSCDSATAPAHVTPSPGISHKAHHCTVYICIHRLQHHIFRSSN